MFKRIVTFALITVFAAPAAFAQNARPKTPAASAAGARDAMGKLTIDGGSMSIVGCAGGQFYTAHALGFITAGTRVRVNFQSGETIDPIATLLILQMGANVPNNVRASYVFDDDAGGGRDPRLEFTAEYNGNVVLSVGSYDGAFGCYAAKVEIS